MKKKVIIGIISFFIIVAIIVAVIITNQNNSNKKDTNNQNNIAIQNEVNQNVKKNETSTENVIVKEEQNNMLVQNTIEETPQSNDDPQQPEIQVIGREEEQTNQEIPEQNTDEKVLEMVKENFGTTDGVSFAIVNKENNIYSVSVTDQATTKVVLWYTVNAETGEIQN